MVEFTYKPDWLWLAAGSAFLAALIGWFYVSARGPSGVPLRLVLFGLRLLTLAVVVVCLLDPRTRESHPPLSAGAHRRSG